MRKCSILLMDAAPIIFLAKLGKLELLLEFHIPIFVPREVAFEACEKQAFLEQREQNEEELLIANFFSYQESLNNLFVIRTIVCDAAEAARKNNPAYNKKGLGETAANSLFLNREEYGVNGPALLMYEDANVRNVVFANDDVHFLTTYSMLVAMEEHGRIDSADLDWDILSNIYEQMNEQPLEKHFVDESKNGDTEYETLLSGPR